MTIQEYSQTEAALIELNERFKDVVFNVDDRQGNLDARAARREIKGYRLALEKLRKEIKAPAWQRCKDIDGEAKRITGLLLALEEPIDQQIKDKERRDEEAREAKRKAEEDRVAAHQERIAAIFAPAEFMGRQSSEELQVLIEQTKALEIEGFEEFEQAALDTKRSTLLRLREKHAEALDREAREEQARRNAEELQALRDEKKAREAADFAESLKREAARKKQEEEQRKAQEAEEKRLAEEREALERQKAEEQARIDEENRKIREQQEAIEKARLEQEAKERAQKEQEERRKREAEEAARKAIYPGHEAIIKAISSYFGVPTEVAYKWMDEIRNS